MIVPMTALSIRQNNLFLSAAGAAAVSARSVAVVVDTHKGHLDSKPFDGDKLASSDSEGADDGHDERR